MLTMALAVLSKFRNVNQVFQNVQNFASRVRNRNFYHNFCLSRIVRSKWNTYLRNATRGHFNFWFISGNIPSESKITRYIFSSKLTLMSRNKPFFWCLRDDSIFAAAGIADWDTHSPIDSCLVFAVLSKVFNSRDKVSLFRSILLDRSFFALAICFSAWAATLSSYI